MLDGADSVYQTFSFPKQHRFISNTRTVTNSTVTLPQSSTGKLVFPTAGVVHSTGVSRQSGSESGTPHWLNVIVMFDGTRTPEAYSDGARFTLDLVNGIATPKPISRARRVLP